MPIIRTLLSGSVFAAAFLAASGAALAGTTPDMTPPALDLNAFLAQSKALHATTPQVPASVTAQGGDVTAAAKPVSAADQAAIDEVLSLSGHAPALTASAKGLAMGQGRLPAIPAMIDLDHATAQAMVAAFSRATGITAGDQAQIAATAASADPVMDEKVGLVRTLYRVDGTDALLRHFIATQHMRLIITEVNNHIEIGKLSETDKYRLSAIAAAAETDLEEKVLTLDARAQAEHLSKPELLQLITAFDSDAQRKQTALRLADSGKLDRSIDLDTKLAQIQIVKTYESGQ